VEGDPVDITILGAGPAGLAAAYYAGHRNATVRIIESLERIGGQVVVSYPEKDIFDVAGHPRIRGSELVRLCAEQGLQYDADLRLGEEVETLERVEDADGELLAITTKPGNRFLTRALIVTSGQGAFEPRTLAIDGITGWEGRGLHYVVHEKDAFRGSRCVIVGGGDSALDWTLGLQETADPPIALVHRREHFRALESSVEAARRLEAEGRVRIMAPCEVRGIHGNGRVEGVTVEHTNTGSSEELACDALILLLGFRSHLGAIADWGLELEGRRQVRVNPINMETSTPLVYAAGDAAGYPEKITLITIGMAEAAIAVNNAIARIRGERVQPRYSTD
jgi:ferredoxin/flavodoxin---NADP+ reductase